MMSDGFTLRVSLSVGFGVVNGVLHEYGDIIIEGREGRGWRLWRIM